MPSKITNRRQANGRRGKEESTRLNKEHTPLYRVRRFLSIYQYQRDVYDPHTKSFCIFQRGYMLSEVLAGGGICKKLSKKAYGVRHR